MIKWFSNLWGKLVVSSALATTHLLITGTKGKAISIKPLNVDDYAPVGWVDKDGYMVAKIVAHEQSDDGKFHQHFTVYTAGADFTRHIGRMDFQYGRDIASVHFEDSNVRICGGATFALRSPKGKYFELVVDEKGVLSTKKQAYDKNDWADKDAPFVSK